MRPKKFDERDRHPTEGVSAMYSVVMVVAMTGAPEVPQCDFFCCKPKVCCTTTQVCSTPQPDNCCPQPKQCCLLKCFSFCGHGNGHSSMAAYPAQGCGTVVIPPQTGTVVPGTDIKKDMPRVDPKPADPKKLGPAPIKIG
jgi:hypothetical protein